MATEQQAEAAIKKLKAMIEAAENSNQHGEDAVVAAAAGLDSLAALRIARADISVHCNDGAPETVEALSRVCDAIARAEGRMNSGSSGPDNAGGRQAASGGGESAEKVSELAALKDLVWAVEELIEHSHGVVGLHLNGDVAPWDEITDGGRFEEWLLPPEDARIAIAKAEGRS